jgi:hypothetical protein
MSDTENTLHAHLKAGQLYTHISGHKIDKSHYRWESSDMYVDSIKISMLPLYFLIRTRQMTHHYPHNRLIFHLCIFSTLILTSQVNSFSTTAKKWWWQVCLKKVSKKFQKQTGNSTTRLLCWTNNKKNKIKKNKSYTKYAQ